MSEPKSKDKTPDKAWEAWGNHWKGGHLSSIALGAEIHEDPVSLAGWEAFFGYIQSGAIILDIATGNGIVPALAKAHAQANDKKFEIVAIDKADIDPEMSLKDKAEAIKDVLFLGEIEAEDLPFESGWFDAVISQYGIEYSDCDKSLSEVARVLKSQGIIRFVCHAKDGVLVEFNTPKAAQCRFILEKSGVLEALEEAVKAALENPDDRLETRETLKRKVDEAKAFLESQGNNKELDQFLKLVVDAYITRENFESFDHFKEWHLGTRKTLEDQILMMDALENAALSEKELIAIGEKLSTLGFNRLNLGKLEVGPEKKLLAYTIEGMKT